MTRTSALRHSRWWSSDVDGALGESAPGSDGFVTISSSALSIATHTISMTVSDEVGAVCVDDIVFIVSRPVVSIASPADGSVANSGEVVTFLGSYGRG